MYFGYRVEHKFLLYLLRRSGHHLIIFIKIM